MDEKTDTGSISYFQLTLSAYGWWVEFYIYIYIYNSNISKQDFYSVLSYAIFVVCSFPLSYLEQNEI